MAMRERRSQHWVALLAGTLLLVSCVMLVYESVREYFPRADLRAFDTQLAELLSAERRAAYERELFGELSRWNRISRLYPTEAGVSQREERWRELAREGLELAHISLQVLQPVGGFVYPLEGPMTRLQMLAERGDLGAMCLMTGLVAQVKSLRVSVKHFEIARKWLIQGAELGHPECQLQLGRRLILGIDGVTKDAKRGLTLELAARRVGYAHDVDGLVSYFQQRWSSDPADLTRLYCWLSIGAQSGPTDRPQNMLRLLRAEARRAGMDYEGLMRLANRLENSQFSLQACVDLSQH
jgi:hypothetical protein